MLECFMLWCWSMEIIPMRMPFPAATLPILKLRSIRRRDGHDFKENLSKWYITVVHVALMWFLMKLIRSKAHRLNCNKALNMGWIQTRHSRTSPKRIAHTSWKQVASPLRPSNVETCRIRLHDPQVSRRDCLRFFFTHSRLVPIAYDQDNPIRPCCSSNDLKADGWSA